MKKSLKVFSIYVALILVDGAFMLYNMHNWGSNVLTVRNLIVFLIVYIACCYAFDKYETVIADVPNIKAYISQLFFDRPDKFIWFWYKMPKNWKPFFACIGYVYVYMLCVGEVVRIFEWLAVTFNMDMSGYDKFRAAFCFGRFDMAVALISIIPLIYIWIIKEYKKSRISLGKVE